MGGKLADTRAQLAQLNRTDDMLQDVIDIATEIEGAGYAVAFPGLNALQFTNTSNTGVVFFPLSHSSEGSLSAEEINARINQGISQLKGGQAFSLMPPPTTPGSSASPAPAPAKTTISTGTAARSTRGPGETRASRGFSPASETSMR